MPPVVIPNPIINSPFAGPQRHFRFDADGQITADIETGRRPSDFTVAGTTVAPPKKKGKQQPTLLSQLPVEKRVHADTVNRIRSEVKLWRDRGWPDVSGVTRSLLDHWTEPTRSRRLFFCQVEIVPPAIADGVEGRGSRAIKFGRTRWWDRPCYKRNEK